MERTVCNQRHKWSRKEFKFQLLRTSFPFICEYKEQLELHWFHLKSMGKIFKLHFFLFCDPEKPKASGSEISRRMDWTNVVSPFDARDDSEAICCDSCLLNSGIDGRFSKMGKLLIGLFVHYLLIALV